MVKEQSRKQFIKSCFYVILSGFSSFFVLLCSGGKKEEKTNNLSHVIDRQKKEKQETAAAAQIDPGFEPGYLKLHKSGELKRRGEELWNIMESCELCPRRCGVNRLEGEEGFCEASSKLEISSFHPHFGEERSLVGKGGSGTIFFTNCNLRCVFCINWEISQGGVGSPKSLEDLAEMMLTLQKGGCHNINIVTPTPPWLFCLFQIGLLISL